MFGPSHMNGKNVIRKRNLTNRSKVCSMAEISQQKVDKYFYAYNMVSKKKLNNSCFKFYFNVAS